jgi:hypothetical protein
VVFGRRRDGKTRLLAHWLARRSALRNRYPDVAFEVLDASILKAVRGEPLDRDSDADHAMGLPRAGGPQRHAPPHRPGYPLSLRPFSGSGTDLPARRQICDTASGPQPC